MDPISRDEFHDFKKDLFYRLERVEGKLDTIQTAQHNIALEQTRASAMIAGHENFIGGARKNAWKGAVALVVLLLFGQIAGQMGLKEAARLFSALFGNLQ